MTGMIATELGRRNVTITSGLARGIDTAAHKASLETGTIAVVAGGLNRIYPRENLDLARIIARKGLLISEMPWDWQARSQDFPRRNRIISGISAGTLVIEAARRSGSLITARHALEQGREVFAIPGSPLDPRAGGTNHLIKQGACLTSDAQDILDALAHRLPTDTFTFHEHAPRRTPEPADSMPLIDEPPTASRKRFTDALSATPTAIDDLIRISGLRPSHVQMLLLELDLAGRLERHGNQAVSLKF